MPDIKQFAIDFRDGLIGTQPMASKYMCAMVSIPLRAALEVLLGIKTRLVTQGGHTFLVTQDGCTLIDPTIDQFARASYDSREKILVEQCDGINFVDDARLEGLPFIELMENFKRLYSDDGQVPNAKSAGAFVAQYIYYPLAQNGFFDARMN